MSATSTTIGDGLFRPEAVLAKRHEALGRISIATPLAHWVLAGLVAIFAATLVLYLTFGHYTRRATVAGELVPSTGLITLNAAAVGRVTRVMVAQGEPVKRGQSLVAFDNPLDSMALGNTRTFIAAQLQTERSGLSADLATQKALAASQAQELRERIAALSAQQVQTRGQLALQQQEATSMQGLLDKIAPLAGKGYVSTFELQQQQANALGAQMQVKALRRQQLATAQQIADAEQQLAQLPLNLATEQTATQNKRAEVEQALAQNEAQRAWILRAPRSGIVSALLIKPGQAATPGRPLLALLPTGSMLEAQLLVPSAAVGFVRPGQRVVLRYQAFPYQKFGQHYGIVASVSHSALSPSEITSLLGQPQQAPQPLYRVMVRLGQQHLDAYGRPAALMPGMALNADILLDRRRLIEWVIEPVVGFGRRLLGTPAPHGAKA